MSKTVRMVLGVVLDAVVLAVTLVVFFVGFSKVDKAASDYIAFLFVLVAEAFLFTGAALAFGAKKNRAFACAGVVTSLWIYFAASAVVSIMHRIIFGTGSAGLIVLQVILLAGAVTAVSIFSAASRSLHERSSGSGAMQICEDAVFSLMEGKLSDDGCRKELQKLFDAFRFSDKTVSLAQQENKIEEKTRELENSIPGGISEVTLKSEEIISLIKERNRLILQSKTGAY